MTLYEYVKSAILLSVCVVLVMYCAGVPVSSFRWAGAPSREVLEPLILDACKTSPGFAESSSRSSFSFWENLGRVTSARLLEIKVGQARYGNDSNGLNVTYWPIPVTIETKYERVENNWVKLNNTQRIFHTTRDVKSTYFAWKADGVWQVSFYAPNDKTRFYKYW